jgi:hypothetical protein
MESKHYRVMRVTILCLIHLLSTVVWAQTNHFLYIQTANKSPFYVKMNGDLLSSTESGYLIIPQVIDDEINMSIGFVKKQWPEQQYRLGLNGKDRGLNVQFRENGLWDLVDLQTSEVILTADKMPAQVEPPTDEFSRVLAEISNEKGTAYSGINNKSISAGQQIELVYSLLYKNRRKMIFILKEKTTAQKIVTDTVEIDLDYRDAEMIERENKEREEKEKRSLDSIQNAQMKTVNTDSVKLIAVMAKETKEPIRFTACKQVAEEKDFMQLRKKMAGADTELDMLDEAGKAFKKKCYTTEQLRNLSMLILQDDNRYRFFELAYPVVTDKNNFALLQTLLNGDQNIERFKALIR